MIKWLPDVGPGDRAVDVAARSLQTRLDAVRRYLKWSVERKDEPEHVHQLRVWTRRADAALTLYADLLPKRCVRRLRKRLRKIRRVAGRVRDCDVLAARSGWTTKLQAERARAYRKLVGRYERLERGRRLKRWARRLLDRLRARNADRTEAFVDRGRDSLRPLVRAFFAADPDAGSDPGDLHRFRIRAKRLRYAMELLAGAFPPSFRDELYPVVGTVQEKLGTVNDLNVAQARLEKKARRAADAGALSDLRRRSAATGEDLARACEEFGRWWTRDARDALRERFDELLRTSGTN
ncbi:MAG TPA: CHAD domain-containing protein [Gemmataceae bacterium]|nr:CHAD domain-containing protein [Gemmataceae bacterium]